CDSLVRKMHAQPFAPTPRPQSRALVAVPAFVPSPSSFASIRIFAPIPDSIGPIPYSGLLPRAARSYRKRCWLIRYHIKSLVDTHIWGGRLPAIADSDKIICSGL